MRRLRLVTLHRWLGLAAAAFWLLQAVTGTLIVFHWEIRDGLISRVERPLDLAGIEHRLDALAPPGSKAAIGSMWTTAGTANRFDIFFTDAAGADRSVRIAGDGTVLRGADAPPSFLDTLVGLHHNLLADTMGDWIIAVTGLLLMTNLIAGLAVAWPRKGAWAIVLKPIRRGPAVAQLHSWHRAIGLWLIAPALLLVAAGTLLKFPDGVSRLAGAEPPSLPALPARGEQVGFATATAAALKALPGSRLVSVSFPEEGDATYRIRVQTPEEMLRAYGASQVLIDANDGSVRDSFPIVEASLGTRAYNALVPIHTGQAGGLPGRLLVLLIGFWLTTMIITGLLLWMRRRRKKRNPA